jgi:hypothetical protein
MISASYSAAEMISADISADISTDRRSADDQRGTGAAGCADDRTPEGGARQRRTGGRTLNGPTIAPQ